MRILFLQPYPTEGPSSRYRVEQFIPGLRARGWDCCVRPFLSPGFYRIRYTKGQTLRKIWLFFLCSIRRAADLGRAFASDIVFIHLEAFPLGPPLFEWILFRCGKKIVYDIDDAIYLGRTSPANRSLRFLKCPGKIPHLIRMADAVVTCNTYLGDYCRRWNKEVSVIHTALDTDRFSPPPASRRGAGALTIGWIGSHSTAAYLDRLQGILVTLAREFSFRFLIVGAGEYLLRAPGVRVEYAAWRLDEEVERFRSLDIGVYPLPDDEWVLGKTGFKTLQFMSVGVPCVASAVGTNRQIIRDGVNGFLAKTDDEWLRKLRLLLQDERLRRSIGDEGRRTVESTYSLKIAAARLEALLQSVHQRR